MVGRISELLNIMLPTNVLADIGCDHGKAGVAALKAGIVKKVIFSDISRPSLNKAQLLCENENLLNDASFVCCDGCDGIGYADTLLIAGMGGQEIISILSKCRFMPRQLILQPMRNQKELREYLKTCWYTEIDKTVFDKKFYTVVRCSAGRENPDELELTFGKTNLKEKSGDFKRFVEKETAKANTLAGKNGAALKWRKYLDLLDTVRGNYD